MLKSFDSKLGVKNFDQLYITNQLYSFTQLVAMVSIIVISIFHFCGTNSFEVNLLVVSVLALIANFVFFQKFNNMLVSLCIFFLSYNLVALYLIFMANEAMIALVLIAFGNRLAVLLHNPILLFSHFVMTQCILAVGIFYGNIPVDIHNLLSISLLSIQFFVLFFGILFKLVNGTFYFKLRLDKQLEEYETLNAIAKFLSEEKSRDFTNIVEFKDLGLCDKKVKVDKAGSSLIPFFQLLDMYTLGSIQITCSEQGMFVCISGDNEERIVKNVLNLENGSYNKMQEYLLPEAHILYSKFSEASIQVSFCVLPNQVHFKLNIEESENESSIKKNITTDITSDQSNVLIPFRLSPRETQIVQAILGGRSYKQIAWEMDISINTVKTVLRRAYKKCDVNSATELSAKLYSLVNN